MLDGRRENITENMRVRESSASDGCTMKIKGDVFVNKSVCQRANAIEAVISEHWKQCLGFDNSERRIPEQILTWAVSARAMIFWGAATLTDCATCPAQCSREKVRFMAASVG